MQSKYFYRMTFTKVIMDVRVKIMKNIILLAVTFLLISGCQPNIPEDLMSDEHGTEVLDSELDESQISETVTYGDSYQGYLVRPDAEGKFPGVILIHEWWGLNDNIRNTAHDLAKEGFVVLAVDLYDGKVAEVADDARIYATEARNNPEKSINHLKSAVEFLRQNSYVSGKVASFGYCFGGGMSMQLALNDDLDATVIYYGSLETDETKLSSIGWPVLGVFGEEDTSITPDSVRQFNKSINSLGINNEIYLYDGVGHAFANPSNPGHDPEKTKDAWEKTVSFLNRHLKQ